MARGAPESSAVRRAEDGLDESSAEVVVLREAMEGAVLRVETVPAVLPVAMMRAGRKGVTVRAVRREAIAATVRPVETVRAVLRVASVGAGRPEAMAATVWPEGTARVVLPVAMVREVRQAVTVRAVRREAIAAAVWPGVTGDFVTIPPTHSVGSPARERGANHAAATMPTH